MIGNIYLQIILFKKNPHLTFLLSCKINLQQNWIKIYECLQIVIHTKCHGILSLLQDHIHGINKCNKITLCMSCDKINGY